VKIGEDPAAGEKKGGAKYTSRGKNKNMKGGGWKDAENKVFRRGINLRCDRRLQMAQGEEHELKVHLLLAAQKD